MLWRMHILRDYALRATDGTLGDIHDFLFDDARWTVRYLVVDTSHWLFGRRVLIAPEALGHPDGERQEFPVSLSKAQVKDSPDIDTDQPISRQHETALRGYYGWGPWWGLPPLAGGAPPAGATTMELARDATLVEGRQAYGREGDPHLRSAREVDGYHIAARDGDIGHVEDFIVDEQGWVIRYMIVDTRNWLPGRKVLVSPDWAENIDWAERKVQVGLPRDAIKDSPAFDPSSPVDRSYEHRLYGHYERPPYW